MRSFSVQIDELTYQSAIVGISCSGYGCDRAARPRALFCFSGESFEVAFLRSADGVIDADNLALLSICVPYSIVSLCQECFSWYTNVSFVAFEDRSRLSVIEPRAFSNCSLLVSICIPSGVQSIGWHSFLRCQCLAHVGFGRHSSLSRIQSRAFWDCSELQSIWLPASLETMERSAFDWSCLGYVDIEGGNRHFSISGDHLLVLDGVAIVGHFGHPSELCIGNEIEELFDDCFTRHNRLLDISFEPGSRLRRIGNAVFTCSCLRSIVIPASVESLDVVCFGSCSELVTVIFEPNSRLSFISIDAFVLCPSLKTVRIPACVSQVAVKAVSSCRGVDILIV
jgi:hypothetical protein